MDEIKIRCISFVDLIPSQEGTANKEVTDCNLDP